MQKSSLNCPYAHTTSASLACLDFLKAKATHGRYIGGTWPPRFLCRWWGTGLHPGPSSSRGGGSSTISGLTAGQRTEAQLKPVSGSSGGGSSSAGGTWLCPPPPPPVNTYTSYMPQGFLGILPQCSYYFSHIYRAKIKSIFWPNICYQTPENP